MANREEALRRIFDAAGVGARLTDDQKRELVAHLEDSVEKKVAAGVAEIDAVGQAFHELGDLQKIARQFPDKPAAAVTPEGVRVLPDSRAYGWMAFCFLTFFVMMGSYVAPHFTHIFHQVRVPLPGLTLFFMSLSDALLSRAGMAGLVLFCAALLVLRLRKVRIPPPVSLTVLLGSVILCLGLVISLFLPPLSLLEGVGHR